jgi:hypothetical protein
MRIGFLIVTILFLNACANIKVINRETIHANDGVEVDTDKLSNERLNTPNEKPVIVNEETIRIGENGGEVFSNTNVVPLENSEPDIIKSLRVGISFGPGLSRSISYVEVLKELERQNIQLNLITGNEFGAIIAALYANGITPEMIEWMFFKYFKEMKNLQPYSTKWIEEVDVHFLTKLKNIKIEELKIKFYLTLFDHVQNKAYFFNRGNVRDLILLSLRLTDNALKFKDGKTYSGTFEKEVFNVRLMKSVGADFTIAVDSLTGKLTVSDDNKEILEKLKLTSLKALKEKKGFDVVLNLPLQDFKLDSGMESSNEIEQSNSYTKKQIQLIKKKIKIQIEQLNSKNTLRE